VEGTMTRIDIAKAYVDELVSQRSDIIAAWVGGSVARGEETECSDIDLGLMAAHTRPGVIHRSGVDTWRSGVYIEAGLVAKEDYQDLETVLNHPNKATHINDARILYDPTGFLTALQAAVRPHFMERPWLRKRLRFWLEMTRMAYGRLSDAVLAADPVEMIPALRGFAFGVMSIHLLQAGITPSSSRVLAQVSTISPDVGAAVADLEGSTDLSADDVLALQPLLQEALLLIGDSYGQLSHYFLQKSLWLAQQGQPQAALHAMWTLIYGAVEATRSSEDPVRRTAGSDLAWRWLAPLRLADPEVWKAKLPLADSLLRQAEELIERV
jgi:hypothetical protein